MNYLIGTARRSSLDSGTWMDPPTLTANKNGQEQGCILHANIPIIYAIKAQYLVPGARAQP